MPAGKLLGLHPFAQPGAAILILPYIGRLCQVLQRLVGGAERETADEVGRRGERSALHHRQDPSERGFVQLPATRVHNAASSRHDSRAWAPRFINGLT